MERAREKEFHAEGSINKCRQAINTACTGNQKQLVWLVVKCKAGGSRVGPSVLG